MWKAFFSFKLTLGYYENKSYSKLDNLAPNIAIEKRTSITMPKFLYQYQCLTMYFMYEVGMSISGAACKKQ